MGTIKQILETIDTSKMVRRGFHVCLEKLCDSIDVYEYIEQPENDVRLTFCYYHSWICKDSGVGIRVWYLDNKPVCISQQEHRNYKEIFNWISKETFDKTRDYIYSLIKESEPTSFNIAKDKDIKDVLELFATLEFKTNEQFNIKPKSPC